LAVKGSNEKYAKLDKKDGEWLRHFCLRLEFWDPLHISEMVEARNFKHVYQSVQIA